jgi:hypothetical protein
MILMRCVRMFFFTRDKKLFERSIIFQLTVLVWFGCLTIYLITKNLSYGNLVCLWYRCWQI